MKGDAGADPSASSRSSPPTSSLRSLKASESVARDIVDDIVVRRLREGDGLPPESAMLQQYGVSRETLREGLRLLEVQGLISIRRGPGGGPIVGAVDPANLGRTSTLYYHLAGATYAELFEAWVVCERIIAELAAANPDRDAVRAAMAPVPATARGGRGDARRVRRQSLRVPRRRRLARPQQGAPALADGDRARSSPTTSP